MGGPDTVRAVALFSVLLLLLLGTTVQLAFRELSLAVLKEGLDLGRAEAHRIAEEVQVLGATDRGIDFSRVRKNARALEHFIDVRIANRLFITYVEVRDRFGVRQFFVVRKDPDRFRAPRREVPPDWPTAVEQVVSVPLQHTDRGLREGEVRLGVAPGPILDDLAELRNSLRVKVGLAAFLAVIVLIAGFLYVLHLLRKNRRLEQARQSADRAAYTSLLARGLTHEIRNPLNAMNINLQMLEEELQADPSVNYAEHAELLESTRREIVRLDQLVKNFLEYARPAQPRFELRDLNDVVRDTQRFLENDFRQHRIELLAELSELLPATELDESLIRQALINLLVNARQVMRNGGRVVVRTRPGSTGEVLLEVEDNGPGIRPEARERIFEVFYSQRAGGTGLGLPIARQIVESHGGTIEVESEEGKGTRFRIRLPRRHGGAPAMGEAAAGGARS